jgi:hypothetical protein
VVSSDPYDWLRPIYRTLASEGSFVQLAPIVQFQRLIDAAAAISEAKAAPAPRLARGPIWSPRALGDDGDATSARSERRAVARAEGRSRAGLCRSLPARGIDQRQLENGDIRRMRLLREAPTLQFCANVWRAKLPAWLDGPF